MDASSPDGQPLTMMHEARQDVVHGPLRPKPCTHLRHNWHVIQFQYWGAGLWLGFVLKRKQKRWTAHNQKLQMKKQRQVFAPKITDLN